MGPLHRDVEELAGKSVGGSRAAAHVGRPARRQRSVEPLRPPQAELQHRLAAGGLAHPRRLGGDEGLKADDVEEHGLQDLALQDGSSDPHQGLVREHHRPLRNGVHVTGEPAVPQIVEKGILEQPLVVVAPQLRQVLEVAGIEPETLQHPDDVPEPATHGETAMVRIFTKGEVKHRFLLSGSGLPVGVRHGELVEVRQQREGVVVELFEGMHTGALGCVGGHSRPV